MSNTLISLNRKITGANKLRSVVHTMKVLAASSISQYETSVRSLGDYYQNVKSGLYICLHETADTLKSRKKHSKPPPACAVVMGSDQGLVGRFNDVITDYAMQQMKQLDVSMNIWAVGERASSLLEDAGVKVNECFDVPSSVSTISSLGSRILLETEKFIEKNPDMELSIFYNSPKGGTLYQPTHQRLLPLDEQWLEEISDMKWPTKNLPEAVSGKKQIVPALISEYLFVSLFRACAESLMSENAARLAAMQRAEKNIDELLDNLTLTYHRLRQDSIDEELFDVIAGASA